MSGHSKWSTIKRAKGANDKARGLLFSKLSRAITIAAKTGGSSDPSANFKLRIAIDAARASNMPKDNIERAISKATTESGNVDEMVYEGFGPQGVSVVVEAATDNRNRTAQEMKNLFERNGGNLGSPGSVSFNFETKGYLLVKKTEDPETQMLTLIDLGVDDINESDEGLDVYVERDQVYEVKNKLTEAGFEVEEAEIIRKPLNVVTITDENQAQKILHFLDTIEENDDVQRVFANIDIPQALMERVQSS